MFMRLCVAVFSIGSVQGALAAELDPIFNHKNTPTACQIHSPVMKLISACSRFEPENANPRFYGTIEAGATGSPTRNSGGVNFCYNSLVHVQTNGDQLRVSVLRDNGKNPTRSLQSVKLSNLRSVTPGGVDYVLPMPGLSGHCYGYTDQVDAHCKGMLGGRTNNVDMTLSLDFHSGKPRQSVTAERGVINEYRRNGNQLSSSEEVNRDQATDTAIAYARQNLSQVISPGARKTMTRFIAESWLRCDGMLSEMESARPGGTPAAVAENRLRDENRHFMKTFGAPAQNSPAPAAGSPAGVREGGR